MSLLSPDVEEGVLVELRAFHRNPAVCRRVALLLPLRLLGLHVSWLRQEDGRWESER